MASMKSEEEHFNVMVNLLRNKNPELTNYMTLAFQYRQNIHIHLNMKLAKGTATIQQHGTPIYYQK